MTAGTGIYIWNSWSQKVFFFKEFQQLPKSAESEMLP